MKRPRVNRQAVVGTVLEYVWMIFGMFIYSFGWLACIMPANTLGGGAAGLSLLFYHITGLPIGMLTLIVNGVLLLIGGTIVGWNFGMKTIFCIAMLSVTMSVLQPLLAAVTPAGQTLFALDPVSDRILLVILGGIIAGIGIAICFRQGGSTGGTDIIAMIVRKYTSMNIGMALMVADALITVAALFCFGIQSGLFCILGLLMKSVLVDYVTDSFRMKKCFQIITTNPEPIVDFITVNLHRGATLEDVYGAFHHERKTMIITVLTRAQALALRRFIHMNDPHAFMVITASTEIVGKGFLAS